MGVDAEILLKPNDALDSAAIARLSHGLVADVGKESFYRYPAIWPYEYWDHPHSPAAAWFSVAQWHRYYGEGYERGHWPTIRSILVWCMARFPGEVWYGGDSGVQLTRMTPETLADLDALWPGEPDYNRSGPSCPRCSAGMPKRGSDYYECQGCDYRADSKGTPFIPEREKK